MAPPQIVAQHHHGTRSRRAAIRIHKDPPQHRPLSQHIKIIAGRHCSRQLFGALPSQCGFQKRLIRQQSRKHVIAIAVIFVFGIGKQPRLAMNIARELSMEDLVDTHNLFRPWNWQQPQRHSIQYRKNPRVHADAQGDRQYRDHREPWILRQCPRPIPQITPKCFQGSKAPHLPANLFHPRRIPKFAPRRVPGISRCHSGCTLFLLAHRQVKSEFFVQIPLQLSPAEQRLHPGPHFHSCSSNLSATRSFQFHFSNYCLSHSRRLHHPRNRSRHPSPILRLLR